jgi:uncharacterized protein (DUF305 family)
MKKRSIAVLGFVALLGVAAQAQHQSHAPAPAAGASPSTKSYQDANARMHKDMAIRYSGDADIDFARGMIPHHRGAVDMAKIVLQYGKDPELRKLAQEIIASQEKEIAFMQGWLKAKGQ